MMASARPTAPQRLLAVAQRAWKTQWGPVGAFGGLILLYLCFHSSSFGGSRSNERVVVDEAVYNRIVRQVPDIVDGIGAQCGCCANPPYNLMEPVMWTPHVAALLELLDNVKDGGAFTFFAPSKEAFRRLERLTDGHYADPSVRDLLFDVLATHMLATCVLSSDVPPHGLKAESITGRVLHVTPSHGHGLKVDGITASTTNLRVGRGVVHILTHVSLTPTIVAQLRNTKESRAQTLTLKAGGGLHPPSRTEKAAPTAGVHARAAAQATTPTVAIAGSAHAVDTSRPAGTEAEGDAMEVVMDESLNRMRAGAHDGRRWEAPPRAHAAHAEPARSGGGGGGGGLPHHTSSARARRHLMCSGRGVSNGTTCQCVVMYTGSKCQNPISLGKGGSAKSRAFDGHLVLNAEHLHGLTQLKVETPIKTIMVLSNITQRVRTQLTNILPEIDPIRGHLYSTCALVASSGILMRHDLGAQIDEHDMVLRFNGAPTKGYEHFVGQKTTYRISNGEHLGFREYNETVIHHLRAQSFLVKLLWFKLKFPDRMPYVIDPDFAAFVARSVEGIPSSGYFAILFAAQICHTINLFGFYASNRHGARHHYYNSEVPSNVERDDNEYQMVMDHWVKRGRVNFGDPCVTECHANKEACETCMGGEMNLEDLAMRERWTPAMKLANAKRESAWKEFGKWDEKMDLEYVWDEVLGLMPVPFSKQQKILKQQEEHRRSEQKAIHDANRASKLEIRSEARRQSYLEAQQFLG